MKAILKQFNIPPVWTVVFAMAALMLSVLDPFQVFNFSNLGSLIFILGFVLFFWAASQFKGKETTIVPRQKPTELLAEGPFRISRNPIYLGFLLIVLGVAIYTGSLLALLAPFCYFFFLRKNYVIPEERKMIEGLGDVAREYFARTGRWVWFL